MTKLILVAACLIAGFFMHVIDAVAPTEKPRVWTRWVIFLAGVIVVGAIATEFIDYRGAIAEDERQGRIEDNTRASRQTDGEAVQILRVVEEELSSFREEFAIARVSQWDKLKKAYPLGFAVFYTDGTRSLYEVKGGSRLNFGNWDSSKLLHIDDEIITVAPPEVKLDGQGLAIWVSTWPLERRVGAGLVLGYPKYNIDLDIRVVEDDASSVMVVVGGKPRTSTDIEREEDSQNKSSNTIRFLEPAHDY